MEAAAIDRDEREQPTEDELREAWPLLAPADRFAGFRLLPTRTEREDFFFTLSAGDQADLIARMVPDRRRAWLRMLDPDDITDVLQETEDPGERRALMDSLEPGSRKEVAALLAFAEDDAGGLMSPRFARVRPDMTCDEAISYLRRQAKNNLETIYYAYVLDPAQHLLGVVSLRGLFATAPERLVSEVMETDVEAVDDETDQEEVSRLLAEQDLLAIPVLDDDGRMQGIVTFDDVHDVLEEEATEDIQRMGGTAALEDPYLETSHLEMLKKRGGWLTLLFGGQLLTAWVMGLYEAEARSLVHLLWFVPLIVASGGNGGSQTATLVIRAMALDEVKLGDWWRIVGKELIAGLLLGTSLGALGVVSVIAWQNLLPGESTTGPFGTDYFYFALTVGISLLVVVTWGTLVGSMLPFALSRLGFDPASASAPFVATLVDVCGVVIYFSVAIALLF